MRKKEKMKERQAIINVIRGSIRKWSLISVGLGNDYGPENCPLCKMFYDFNAQSCLECPVSNKTGQEFCNGTPYDDCLEDSPQTYRTRANKELMFLQRLLEDEKESFLKDFHKKP